MGAAERYWLECFSCKTILGDAEGYVRCPHCGGPTQVKYDYEAVKDAINLFNIRSGPSGVMKYFDFYPLSSPRKCVSLGEGGTPMLECKKLSEEFGCTLSVKNEGANPTGSFKDRGTMVELSKAIEAKAQAVTVASTGNMAASVSAYSAKASVPCYVTIPDGTPMGKLCQTISFGARVIQVKGDYGDAVRVTEGISAKYGYRVMGDYAYRAEGQKSIAFEIAGARSFGVPDYVVVPMGVGTNLTAVYKGFEEFAAMGITDSIPRIIGVEATGANAIVTSFNSGEGIKRIRTNTLASAINVGYPYDGPKAIDAMRRSGGFAAEVTDEEMLAFQQELSRKESVFCEPSSASVIAAVSKYRDKLAGADVVAVLTGNGLKDPETALRTQAAPPSITPEMGEVEKFITNRMYEIRAPVTQMEKRRVVFMGKPALEELSAVLEKQFRVNLDNGDLARVSADAGHFIDKGKAVTEGDLSAIVAQVTSAMHTPRVLCVKDYAVETTLAGKSKSRVEIEYRHEALEGSAEGDGPVDAIISAVWKATGNGTWFQLIDYSVRIDAGGPDTTVHVTMSAADDAGNKATVRGASPDVIAASVKAFENAFNALYKQRNSEGAVWNGK